MANKCSSLTLLTPNGKREKLKDTEEHHSSVWKAGVCFAGLTPERYSPEQRALIADLIAQEEWIEEEGNDLMGFSLLNPLIPYKVEIAESMLPKIKKGKLIS